MKKEKLNGWVFVKEYKHFNLYEKRTNSGDIIRQCCKKNEVPKDYGKDE